MSKHLSHYSIIITLIILVTGTLFAQESQPVVMWTTYSDAELEWLNQKADEFNEAHPAFDIQIESKSSFESILSSYSSDDPSVAILHLSDKDTQAVLDQQITRPLDSIINGEETIHDIPVHQSDWFDTVKAHATVQGQWVMIPISMSTELMYVNIGLLEESGTRYTFVPQDWITLEAICKDIAPAIEDESLAGCVTWDDSLSVFENWLAQQNIAIVSNGNGRDDRATNFELTSTGAVDTVSFMQRLVNDGYVAYESGQAEGTAQDTFMAGNVPILFADSTAGLTLDADYTTGVPVANVDFGWSGARLDTENLWITSAVEDDVAQVAVAFSLFLTQPENNIEWHQATGSLPLSHTAFNMLQDSEWAETHPEQIVALNALTDSVADSPTLAAVYGTYDEIGENIRLGLDSIIFSTVDATTGLESIQTFVLELLDEYNLTNAPDTD